MYFHRTSPGLLCGTVHLVSVLLGVSPSPIDPEHDVRAHSSACGAARTILRIIDDYWAIASRVEAPFRQVENLDGADAYAQATSLAAILVNDYYAICHVFFSHNTRLCSTAALRHPQSRFSEKHC
jgi:hypothetical protein